MTTKRFLFWIGILLRFVGVIFVLLRMWQFFEPNANWGRLPWNKDVAISSVLNSDNYFLCVVVGLLLFGVGTVFVQRGKIIAAG